MVMPNMTAWRSARLLLLGVVFCPIVFGESKLPITKIVFRYIAEELSENSEAARPKTMYLAGDRYARVEEETDSTSKKVIVVNEPDIWVADLGNKIGSHTINPGPDFTVHNPILGADVPDELFDFQFGHEMEFLERVGAKFIGSKQIGDVNCETRQFEAHNFLVTVYVNSETRTPVELKAFQGAKMKFRLQYISYEIGRVFEASLFERPKDVHFDEKTQ
jgi:hypothetical protein